ncbi:hypothetical protein GCWU000321_01270 [Dialister invisus DSM 15470]|uniref:Uncharacterized protein n=1 Tax=Dialister invisus DSM 15470 TaxID=592028 RepID=C9LNZ6_9FIRM|nr:hypothetical protein GCWU000321_01270 [Dialister invisus DSM 15470]
MDKTIFLNQEEDKRLSSIAYAFRRESFTHLLRKAEIAHFNSKPDLPFHERE